MTTEVTRRIDGESVLSYFNHVIDGIKYREEFAIDSGYIGAATWDIQNFWFEVVSIRPDAITGELGLGRGGKRYVQRDFTESELVQSVFAAIGAYEEHERREFFKYGGRAVFGPHINIAAHYEASSHTESARNLSKDSDGFMLDLLKARMLKQVATGAGVTILSASQV